ncbi:MAG: uroporphyrinogen-III C-methyltransferase [Glaciecola sp.]|jgi:uroporphyrin-3 C-methyltransferase
MAADAKGPADQPEHDAQTSSADTSAESSPTSTEKVINPESEVDTTAPSTQAKTQTEERVEDREIQVQASNNQSHKSIWIFVAINFIMAVGLVVGAYWYWLNFINTERVDPKVENLEHQYSRLENTVRSLNSALAQANTKIDAQNQALSILAETDNQTAESVATLAQQVQLNQLTGEGLSKRIADVAGRRPTDWLLAEADYLVKLAGKKLFLEEDVKSAIMLLKSADMRIADLSDPSLLPVRALIAKDIQSLQQVNDVATTTIALSVSALIAQVDELPLDTLKLPDPVAPEAQTTVSADVSNWRANLKASWDAIVKDFVSVEKRRAEVQPFMSTKQQWLAREQLKFALLNAQNAILQNEAALFVQSLQASLDTVITHYDVNNQGVKAYMKSIQDLINTDTKQVLPPQLDSQQPLTEIIDQRIQTLFAGGR